MGTGLLPWWRRRIMARGLAGAVLFAVPVAVAAAIGFGTSISGVAGGLSAVTSGPDAAPAAAQTGPNKLNHAVVALANRQTGSSAPASSGGRGSGGVGGSDTTGSGSGSDGGSTSSGGGSGGSSNPVIDRPAAPQITLPGTGGATDGVTNTLNGTVNNVLGGVDKTVNGLLGSR
jgi:hypothetical protein